jgi:flagellar protein FliO/FliZ
LALLIVAGLFAQIPTISAQEVQTEEADPLVAAQRAMTFEESAAAAESPAPPAGPSIWAVIRMLLTLALAAAAIYGVVYIFKRAAKPSAAADPFLKILATAHLGSNRYAHIVNVADKAWLLGSSDGGVNLIGEIDNKDVLNAMLLEESRKSAETAQGRFGDFMAILRRLGVRAEAHSPGADDIRKRRERLKGL